jgi:hypothetical protein
MLTLSGPDQATTWKAVEGSLPAAVQQELLAVVRHCRCLESTLRPPCANQTQ